jgi:hypothetical protein
MMSLVLVLLAAVLVRLHRTDDSEATQMMLGTAIILLCSVLLSAARQPT